MQEDGSTRRKQSLAFSASSGFPLALEPRISKERPSYLRHIMARTEEGTVAPVGARCSGHGT
jgi:hypothetical protein